MKLAQTNENFVNEHRQIWYFHITNVSIVWIYRIAMMKMCKDAWWQLIQYSLSKNKTVKQYSSSPKKMRNCQQRSEMTFHNNIWKCETCTVTDMWKYHCQEMWRYIQLHIWQQTAFNLSRLNSEYKVWKTKNNNKQ